MASKANWHSPSATSVIFFLRIARGGLPIPNKENWHSSFSQRPRRDELFFNIFWTFSGVPVGCSSSGKSALYSIDNLVGSLEDWEDLLSPHFYIQKKWLKNCKNKCCLCHDKKSIASYQKFTTQFSVENPSVTFTLHFINTKCKFFSGNFYILHEFAICTKLCAWIWKAFTAILAAISWRQIKILN